MRKANAQAAVGGGGNARAGGAGGRGGVGVGGGGAAGWGGGCACGSDFFDSPDPEAARLVLKLRARDRLAARCPAWLLLVLRATYWLLAAGTASQEPGGKKEEAIADRCELAAGCWSDHQPPAWQLLVLVAFLMPRGKRRGPGDQVGAVGLVL
jgi:hypothetical protein